MIWLTWGLSLVINSSLFADAIECTWSQEENLKWINQNYLELSKYAQTYYSGGKGVGASVESRLASQYCNVAKLLQSALVEMDIEERKAALQKEISSIKDETNTKINLRRYLKKINSFGFKRKLSGLANKLKGLNYESFPIGTLLEAVKWLSYLVPPPNIFSVNQIQQDYIEIKNELKKGGLLHGAIFIPYLGTFSEEEYLKLRSTMIYPIGFVAENTEADTINRDPMNFTFHDFNHTKFSFKCKNRNLI